VRGYFDVVEAAHAALRELPKTLEPEGVFVALNPLSPSLLARAVNRFELFAKTRAGNTDVLRRVWLPIDADPVRPAGISATAEELSVALTRTDALVDWLASEGGWPLPMRGSGGNSGHALYAIDLPNDAETDALLKRVYAVVAATFTDKAVVVDTSVQNAARIWTLYGTRKRKGDHTLDRPHRRSWIAAYPSPMDMVTRDHLEVIARLAGPTRSPRPSGADRASGGVLDMVAEFTARGWYGQALTAGRHAVTCPWADEHSGTSGPSETVLFEPRDLGGVWGFKCQHAHCDHRTIRDVWSWCDRRGGRPVSPTPAQAVPTDPVNSISRSRSRRHTGRCS